MTGPVDTRFRPVPDPRPVDVQWPQMAWPVPDDARLVGRVVSLAPADAAADGDELFNALDDDRVWAHLVGRPPTAAACRRDLAARAGEPNRLQWVVRAVAPHAGLPAGAVVGTSSYLEVSVPDARLEVGATAYTPAVWGTAVNPEAKLLLLGYAFDALRVGRVQLKTDVRNVRSQRAIARLGARYEGTLRRYQRRSDATVRDTVLFSVTAEEWPAVRDGLRARLSATRD